MSGEGHLNTGNNQSIFYKFEKDFNQIADTTYLAYTDKNLPSNTPLYLIKWAQKIREIPRLNHFIFERGDLIQQMVMLWICYEQVWNTGKHGHTTKKAYIIKRTLWDIRDWLIQEGKVMDRDLEYKPDISEEDDEKYGMEWLCYGGAGLAPYERYLVYLMSSQHLTVKGIADVVGRSHHTVAKDLSEIISKMGIN